MIIYLRMHLHISTTQWGILPGRSTTDAGLSATHDWHQTLDSGSKVCAIFCDHQKAFDSVSHCSPIAAKLRQLNINQNCGFSVKSEPYGCQQI